MLDKILTYMIPVLSIGLTYVFGRLQSLQSDKKDAYREAYESFYLPFISLLYKFQIWDIGFARLPLKQRRQLFNLTIDNIKYMDRGILDYVHILYDHYNAILEKELLDTNSILTRIFTHNRTDEIFDGLTEKVLFRATWLSKRLHQPPIGKFVLELYLEGKATREKLQEKETQYDVHS